MLNRDEAIKALEDTHGIIQMIGPHMTRSDMWLERSVTEAWRVFYAIPVVIIGFFIMAFIIDPITKFFDSGSITLTIMLIYAVLWIGVTVTIGTKICERKARRAYDSACSLYSLYNSELSFLPDLNYCRLEAYEFMYSMLKAGRANDLNEALAQWDLEVKHRQNMYMQSKIHEELTRLK